MGKQVTYIRRKQDRECYNGEDLERQIFKQACPCTEMDYECDELYKRNPDGSCSLIVLPSQTGETVEQIVAEVHQNQCEAEGFYTASQGYRKVPGNMCVGGVNLEPQKISCGYGLLSKIGSLKGIFYLMLIGCLVYFGWNYIEALIIFLPFPDPKDVQEKVKEKWSGLVGAVSKHTDKLPMGGSSKR